MKSWPLLQGDIGPGGGVGHELITLRASIPNTASNLDLDGDTCKLRDRPCRIRHPHCAALSSDGETL